MKVLLVNANLMQPPVTPIALDLLADSLERAGFTPVLLDLAWSDDLDADIKSAAADDFLFAAVSVRNLEDLYFPGNDSCLLSHRRTVSLLKSCGQKVAIGGAGFSVMPQEAADFLGADFAVAGDGEQAIVALAKALSEGKDVHNVPGLVGAGKPARVELSSMPAPSRAFVDNARYLREGGQVGIETKRGCPYHCAACADRFAKGNTVRARRPESVADEVESLAANGIDVLHTCDSEFNAPREHAIAVCDELIRRSLGERVEWYTYCSPAGFDEQLALLMRRAGCAGIDFAADHGDRTMLEILRCPHTDEDLKRTAEACKKAGIRFMFDLLFGAPGETRDSIRLTIELMRKLSPTRVGVMLGIRLYPQCEFAADLDLSPENPSIHAGIPDSSMLRPIYYLEHALGDDAREWLGDLVANDRRFFYGATSNNYDGNVRLCELISEGARGAYWNILARAAGD